MVSCWKESLADGRGVGLGAALFGFEVTNVVDGVEKNIPEPLSSLIFGVLAICSFSGLWNGFRVGVPKLRTLKLLGSVSPSSRPLFTT